MIPSFSHAAWSAAWEFLAAWMSLQCTWPQQEQFFANEDRISLFNGFFS
jgi:hypothetical protein